MGWATENVNIDYCDKSGKDCSKIETFPWQLVEAYDIQI